MLTDSRLYGITKLQVSLLANQFKNYLGSEENEYTKEILESLARSVARTLDQTSQTFDKDKFLKEVGL